MAPLVSVIVPCYNEQATIRLLLDALRAQTYPLASMEVVVADGMSTDRTREVIAAYQAEHPEMLVRVVDNPRRVIPAALNAGLAAGAGSIFVRVDGHCVPQADYIANCVALLEQNAGENVGGVWDIRPGGSGWVARAIAAAAAHPVGVGDASYRYTTRPGLVDTVPFGAFRRELVERIGAFDETLLTNEDYEFNARVRQSGGRVYLDPAIRSVYFARSSLGALAKQYWRYGFWKVRMLRRYPGTIRWRQALPPLFVLSVLVLGLLTPFWGLARLALAAELALYAAVLLAVGAQVALKRRDPAALAGVPLAVAVMHFSWGAGFLWSMATSMATSIATGPAVKHNP